MGWLIECTDSSCGQRTWADNIVDLIAYHRDDIGRFVCSSCRKFCYISKSFELQEQGEFWEPFIRGIIALGETGETYQPFVFLVSYKPDGEITDVWFSYYKDFRKSGGRLKLGYEPGGPPVLGKLEFLNLLSELKRDRLSDAG
jgi:hypothetical protein